MVKMEREVALVHDGVVVYHAYKVEMGDSGMDGRRLSYHFAWSSEPSAQVFDVRDLAVPSGMPANRRQLAASSDLVTRLLIGQLEADIDVDQILREAIEARLFEPNESTFPKR